MIHYPNITYFESFISYQDVLYNPVSRIPSVFGRAQPDGRMKTCEGY